MKEKLDILFFAPPMYCDGSIPRKNLADDNNQSKDIPRGALCIASFLRKKRFNARVVVPDSFFLNPIDDRRVLMGKVNGLISQKVREYNPRFIGFSLMFGFMEKNVVEIIRFAKKNFPEIKVIVGGNHATFVAERLLSSRYGTGIDVVVRGEGERIVEDLLSGKDLGSIRGISFTNGKGDVIHNPRREELHISDLPPIDFALMDIGDGVDIADFNHIVQFARGCFFDCTFCTNKGMWGKRVRYAGKERFCKELEDVLDCYSRSSDPRFIIFADDDILTSKKSWEFLFPILEDAKERYPHSLFIAQARVSALCKGDENQVHKMLDWARQVGLVGVFLGVESCSDVILKSMNKGYNFEHIKKALGILRKHNIFVGAFWMFGHPGATLEEEAISRDRFEGILSEGLLDFLELHTTFPFSGSAIRDDPRLKILISEDEEPNSYNLFEERAIHCLIDPRSGKTVMSSEQITDAHLKALEIKTKYLDESKSVVDLSRAF